MFLTTMSSVNYEAMLVKQNAQEQWLRISPHNKTLLLNKHETVPFENTSVCVRTHAFQVLWRYFQTRKIYGSNT